MAGPYVLVPVIIAGVTRLVAPKVAQKLITTGVGKAAKKAATDAPKLSAKDADKIINKSNPFVQSKSGAARPVPKSSSQKKIEEAKKGSDIVPVSKPSAPSGGKQVPAKTAEPKLPAKPAESKVPATKIKQPSSATKGRPTAGKTAAKGATATTGLISLTTMDKDFPKIETKDIPTPKRKPSVAPSKNIPVGKREGEAFKGLETAEPKARQTPSMRASMPEKSDGETIGEYFSNLEGRKTKVKTPFGTIDVDSSDAAYSDVNGMNDKFSGSYKGGRPGMKKNAVRRNAGGKVSMGRGMGKALRGGGKVMK